MHFSDVHSFELWDWGVGHLEMNITPTCKALLPSLLSRLLRTTNASPRTAASPSTERLRDVSGLHVCIGSWGARPLCRHQPHPPGCEYLRGRALARSANHASLDRGCARCCHPGALTCNTSLRKALTPGMLCLWACQCKACLSCRDLHDFRC